MTIELIIQSFVLIGALVMGARTGGVGLGLRTKVNSLPIAVNPSGGMNSYWPMPFRKHCRITIENQRWENVEGFFYQITYAETAVSDEAAYFHAQWRRTLGTREYPEHVILDAISARRRQAFNDHGFHAFDHHATAHLSGGRHAERAIHPYAFVGETRTLHRSGVRPGGAVTPRRACDPPFCVHRRGADASARGSARNQRGASPLRAHETRPETEHNCVAARRGGEQWKVND